MIPNHLTDGNLPSSAVVDVGVMLQVARVLRVMIPKSLAAMSAPLPLVTSTVSAALLRYR